MSEYVLTQKTSLKLRAVIEKHEFFKAILTDLWYLFD